jgi:LacI family transcriptional regulator
MTKKSDPQPENRPLSLKVLAEYLGLSPATISLVVNNAPGAKSISPATRERVLAAVKKLGYPAEQHRPLPADAPDLYRRHHRAGVQ